MATNRLLKTVKRHPVGTAAIAGGAVVGALLIGKAARTAAKVVTIKAAANAATGVARAVRGPAKRKTGAATGTASRTRKSAKKRPS